MTEEQITALRMARQHITKPADQSAYDALFRDLQPGLNVYWNGFGQPPTLSFRADFDDLQYNARRQLNRDLIKGRFAGGNLGWIVPEDVELFAALYRKPLKSITEIQLLLLTLIENGGPYTIQQLKAETGLLVKEITPALHRLQEAFLIYEDQYDGDWDRGWYRFDEMFPDADLTRIPRAQALQTVLMRFAYRFVWFDSAMARSFYRLPEKEICAACEALIAGGRLVRHGSGYLNAADASITAGDLLPLPQGIWPLHRNDPLCRAQEAQLKAFIRPLTADLPYDHEPLQYLLIDGEFHGASVGRFRNGPYDLNDVVCDLPDYPPERLAAAIRSVNFGKSPARINGVPYKEE